MKKKGLNSKACLKPPLKRRPKLTDYRLMQVKILSTFIKLPFVIKIFVLFVFEWPLKTGFTVHVSR